MSYVLTDIHFHTNSSFDAYENENKGVFDIDLFLKNEKESINKLGLMVKTDHNILNYPYYVDLCDKIKKNDSHLVLLPGIELNSSESVHWIFIFDDLKLKKTVNNCKIGELLDIRIKELFNYQKLVPSVTELQQAQINKVNIDKFVAILNELGISFLAIPHLNKEKGLYKKLKKNKELVDAVEMYLNDNIISGFESKNYNEFLVNNILQTEQTIEVLKKEVDVIGESEIVRREVHLDLLKRLKMLSDRNYVSSIYGSDFHGDGQLGMLKYEEMKSNLFYMKAFPSFEGLRFALLDYDSRIFNTSRMAKYVKNKSTYIEKIIIEKNGREKTICLGDGLNTIIGSRGSGKSYLIKSIIGDNNSYNETDIFSQIKIKEIVFANGNKMSTLSENMYDVLNQKGKSSSNKYDIYEILAEAPYNTSKFVKSIEKYFHTSPRKDLNINLFVNQFNNYLDCLKKEESLAIKKVDLLFLKEYDEYTATQTEILFIKDKFDRLSSFLEKNIASKNDHIAMINNDKVLAERLEKDLNIVKRTKEYEKRVLKKEITPFDSLINELNSLITKSFPILYNDYSRNKQNMVTVSTRVTKITASISNDLSNEEKGYSEKFSILSSAIHDAIIHLRSRKSIQKELVCSFENDFFDEEFIDFSINDINYSICSRYKFNLFSLTEEQKNDFFINYKKIFSNDIIRELITYGSDEQIKQYFANLDARRHDYHVKAPRIVPEVLIKNVTEQSEYINIIKMSPGQRSNLLLDMILQNSTDKILILDQPEDDLDNETIYKSIVFKLRKLKLRRQLLVITHNANIAINGDSDFIVVCQNKEGDFDCWSDKMESIDEYNFYSINSSLKNVRQIEIATTILDGGKEALRRRVKTLGYKDLFLKGDL